MCGRLTEMQEGPNASFGLPRKGDGIAGLVRPRGGLTSLSSGLTSVGSRYMVSPDFLCPLNSQAKVWWPQEELPGAHAMTRNS